MANPPGRNLFGGSVADWTFAYNGTTMVKAAGVVITFYTALTGGSQVTDLQTTGGSPITSVTTDANSEIPQFYGPPGYFKMAADANSGAGPRRWVWAADVIAGLQPSGDATGVTDRTNIQALLNAGSNVQLGQGFFQIDQPITLPPYLAIYGVAPSGENTTSSGSALLSGSVIQCISSFSQHSAAGLAAILILDQAAGGYPTSAREEKIFGVTIDGSLISSGTVDGVQIWNTNRVHLERVLTASFSGYGFRSVTSSGGNANAMRLNRCQARFNGLDGFNFFRNSDCTYTDCLAENNGGNGFYMTNMNNGLMLGCRAEHNGTTGVGNGFSYENTSQGTGSGNVKFVGCSTDRNEAYGMEIFTNNSTGVPLQLVGCCFRRDGKNNNTGGANLAGLYIHNYVDIVQISGCNVFPGVDDDGTGTNSPQTGLRLASNSGGIAVMASCSYFQGQSNGIIDDQTSNICFDGTVVTDTGGTSANTPNILDLTTFGITVKEGSNASQGVATLAAGTVTVSTNQVAANSRIFLTAQDNNTTGALRVSARTAGTSFTIRSSNAGDTGNVAWEIFTPG